MQSQNERILPASLSFPDSETDYAQWIQRFDLLWATSTSEHDQREMQALLALIEQHEAARSATHRLSDGTTTQGEMQ